MEGRGGPRIAFVGGGSYQWGPKIIQDVALSEELRGGTLVLHDINGEALQDMYRARDKNDVLGSEGVFAAIRRVGFRQQVLACLALGCPLSVWHSIFRTYGTSR